jgi:hypothetical protein
MDAATVRYQRVPTGVDTALVTARFAALHALVDSSPELPVHASLVDA